jgi:hypothetical protein
MLLRDRKLGIHLLRACSVVLGLLVGCFSRMVFGGYFSDGFGELYTLTQKKNERSSEEKNIN